MKRLLVLLASLSLLLGAFAAPVHAGRAIPVHRTAPPPSVRSLDDAARQKLDPKLRKALDRRLERAPSRCSRRSSATRRPPWPPSTAAHVARTPGGEGLAGRRPDQGPAAAQAGRPEERPQRQPRPAQADRQAARQPGPGHRRARSRARRRSGRPWPSCTTAEVPYADAPPLKGSNFEALKKLDLLDAKTHDFAEAWKMGYDGTGGQRVDPRRRHRLGPSRPHRHLADRARAAGRRPTTRSTRSSCWSIRARSTLGLTWYTPTQQKTGAPAGGGTSQVTFATRTGPSRNFAAPDGTASHDYTFPAAWSKSGKVRLGSHPDDYLLLLYGERPAFLVTDPNVAGVYDTVYVDLDDDHDFSDEKPVTKASPVSYRDLNGDGYTDMSGGLRLLHLGRDRPTGTPLPGGPRRSASSSSSPRARCSPGPATSTRRSAGHGTLTASNVVGQGVIAGNAPTFADVHTPTHTYPGAVIGGAPKAKAAPMGDIYFAFEFSTQFAYFLTNDAGIDVISNSYGNERRRQRRLRCGQPGGGPVEPDLRQPDDLGPLDRQRRPRLRHDQLPAAVHRHRRRRVDPVRRDRLGLDQERLPDPRQRRHPVVGPRPGRDRRRSASMSSATARSRPATPP